MNKTLIALAIVAALPVAAQADATISGSLTTKYKNTGAIDTDSRLSVASSEVLANGMTATAGFSITADTDDDTENSGTASLAGDFGTLTAGSIDADGAFQAGDVAGVVADTTESTDGTASSVYGIHYAGTAAGLSVAVQVNANTNAAGVGVVAPVVLNAATATPASAGSAAPVRSTQMSATYEFNGLTAGYSYASAAAANASTGADATTPLLSGHDGVHKAQTVFGVTYAFGDLAVSAGKSSAAAEALVSATYTIAMDALTVVAQMDNSPSGDYQINMSYALGNGLSLSSEIDKGMETTMVASYTAGDMAAMVAKTDDGTTDASVTLDYGNADLTIGRVGARTGASFTSGVTRAAAVEYTHVTYKVAF